MQKISYVIAINKRTQKCDDYRQGIESLHLHSLVTKIEISKTLP